MTTHSGNYRFGPYELRTRARELYKHDTKLKLRPQAVQVLKALVERAGDAVTRDELRILLWHKDTFVDFEHGLNAAISELRGVLNDPASEPRYIETLPKVGYRIKAPIELIETDDQQRSPKEPGTAIPFLTPIDSKAEVPVREGPVQKTGRARVRRLLTASAVAAAAVGLLVLDYVTSQGRPAYVPQPKIKSLAVLPLKNLSGDPAQEYLADGMTEALIGRLSMIGGLRVISRTSVMSLKDSKLSARDIAKTLQVDALVEGSVIREGIRIRVYAQLIRGATDEHFWSETYDRELPDVLALESDVARSVARKVEVTVTGEELSRLVAARHVSPDVYESYLKGQFAKGNSRAEIEQSIAYFEDAITKDDTFAPAYVGLADAYERLSGSFLGAPTYETRPKVVRAAQKALDLDPGLAEAHVLLGRVLRKQFQWAEAEAEYKQALALNPNNSAAYLDYAQWLMSHGRVDEALDWSRRARELDPLVRPATRSAGCFFKLAATTIPFESCEAFWQCTERCERAPVIGVSDDCEWSGRGDDSRPRKDRHHDASQSGRPRVASPAHARAGHRAEAFRLLEELKQCRKTGYIQATSFINPNLGLGNYDEAFVWFERAYHEREGILQWLKVHPFFDPVRGDPRFADLVHRVGLDQH